MSKKKKTTKRGAGRTAARGRASSAGAKKRAGSRPLVKETKSGKVSKKKTGRRAGQTSGGGKRVSLLDAAVKILAKAESAMSCKQIVKAIITKGLWATGGKTPHATLYSAIIRDIAANGKKSRFRKTARGRFSVNSRGRG